MHVCRKIRHDMTLKDNCQKTPGVLPAGLGHSKSPPQILKPHIPRPALSGGLMPYISNMKDLPSVHGASQCLAGYICSGISLSANA